MTHEKPPTLWNRLSDTLFVRRADQTIIALFVLAAILGVGVWWWRHGGAGGRLVDHDQLPQHEAKFVVDVNTADRAELAELPGIGEDIAEKIIAYRNEHGPFRSLEDLDRVERIGKTTLEKLKPHVSFGNVK